MKLNWRGKLINAMSRYRAYYDKGIAVLAIIRNMELTDLGILMAVVKYLFGDHISTETIVIIGACYWVFNVCVNLSVGWFWEKNNGWEIEAQVFGKRVAPGRTVLVSPDGSAYDARDVKPINSGGGVADTGGWLCPECREWCGHSEGCSYSGSGEIPPGAIKRP